MRIEASRRVAAGPEAVFARLTDFPGFEARARARQLPVERLSEAPPAWRIGVSFRGMDYPVELRVGSVTPPEGYVAELATRGMGGTADVRIEPEGDGSLLSVTLDVAGRGLAGRAALQAVALARPLLETRLAGALARLAAEIEGRL
jgi:carbon monoxide dehydrogenase subunit G